MNSSLRQAGLRELLMPSTASISDNPSNNVSLNACSQVPSSVPMRVAAHRLVAVEPSPDGSSPESSLVRVRFTGRSRSGAGFDVGVARSSHALPFNTRYAYFEATILLAASITYSSIGLVTMPCQHLQHPGADIGTFGLKGTDGRKYKDGISDTYGPKWKEGDVIGCGVDFDKRSIFFTLNGRFLGVAFKDVDVGVGLYPAVGLHDPSEIVGINFGSEGWRFDLAAYEQREHEKRKSEIDAISVSSADCDALVKQYLLHSGYHNTYTAFASRISENIRDVPADGILESTKILRGDIRQLILVGDISNAKETIRTAYPGFFEKESTRILSLLMACQEYVELCRIPENSAHLKSEGGENGIEFDNHRKIGNKWKPSGVFESNKKQRLDCVGVGDKEGAMIAMLQGELGYFSRLFSADLSSDGTKALSLVEAVASLSAYNDPSKCPHAYLMHLSQRKRLADVVNYAILEECSHISSYTSNLEILMRQLLCSQNQARCRTVEMSGSKSKNKRRWVNRAELSSLGRREMFGEFTEAQYHRETSDDSTEPVVSAYGELTFQALISE